MTVDIEALNAVSDRVLGVEPASPEEPVGALAALRDLRRAIEETGQRSPALDAAMRQATIVLARGY